jgi:hypothetical protein
MAKVQMVLNNGEYIETSKRQWETLRLLPGSGLE